MNFDRYVGIPWVAGGRSLDGCDCWGLVWLFYARERGIELERYDDAYGDARLRGGDYGRLIDRDAPQWIEADGEPGDVVLFRFTNQPRHVGILAPRRRILHVKDGRQASILEPIHNALKSRILGFYRPPCLS